MPPIFRDVDQLAWLHDGLAKNVRGAIDCAVDIFVTPPPTRHSCWRCEEEGLGAVNAESEVVNIIEVAGHNLVFL